MPVVNPTTAHEPLSRHLARILAGSGADHLTANQLLERTEGRGIYLMFIILSLPFVAWVSLPGMSTLAGLIVGWLALRIAMRKPRRLPAWLGDRQLSPRLKKVVLGGGLKFSRLLEKAVRPRRTEWMSWRMAEATHALLILLMAGFMALPLPSPPFIGCNTLPSYAIILLAASMMERDGVLIWFSYAAVLGTVAYFTLLGGLVTTQFVRWFDWLQSLWGGGA